MSEPRESGGRGERSGSGRTSEFLALLQGLHVRVWEEDGELRVRAPKGALTSELQSELRARKDEILELLKASRADVAGAAASATEAVPRVSREGDLPLSFTQQRLWFLDQLEPEILTYNMWISCTLRGNLDVSALERAVAEIARRHEVLRTTFPTVEGVPQQVIHDPGIVRLEVLEGEWGTSDDWRTDELRRALVLRLKEPFDLGAGPLIRPVLAKRTDLEHALFVMVHHIVFDGVSKAVFFRELTTLYAAFAEGQPSPLPELPIQYADYAAWQKELFEGPELERQLGYWHEQLGGPLPVLELPTDRPRPAIQTHSGAAERIHVPDRVIDALTELGKPVGATLFVVLLAAYKAFLLRYTGQADLTVGTAMANRTRAELEDLIGFFVNTLVLRSDLSGDPTFRELVKRERDVFLGALDHQDMPFQRLVDELQPERSLSHSPLFQTMLVLDEDPGDERVFGKLEVVDFELEICVARTDLVATGYKGRDGFWLWFEYNTDLFERETIVRMLSHFGTLLEAVASDPDRRISDLQLLGRLERQRLLEGWNDTVAEIDERPVHARFEAQVDATPEAVALAFPDGDTQLSYSVLDARANRLAHHLAAEGAAPGQLIGMCLDRSPEMVVSMLAILKTGAAYVPLDPSFPPDRIAYMVEDSGLSAVVTDGSCADLLPDATPRVLLDAAAGEIAARSAERPAGQRSSSERMYVIYTSGSTGRPKGVEVEHRSVSNFLSSMAREPGLRRGETLVAVTTPSFDISVLELFLPLMVGGRLVLASKEATADGELLAALLEDCAPEVVQATPATWRMLLLAGWQGSRKLRVLCGGEALPPELAGELQPRCAELWNMYGPTETTIWSTVSRVEAGVGTVAIGRPIANTRVYVLDAARRPVPLGVTGELWIGGGGLARGYLGRPELTGERFVADPFAPGGDRRMYLTGDLARWRNDGTLECLGRIDHQVKLRGFRIELGEIESILSEEPGVGQCVCAVREDSPGDQRLVAYWVSGDGAQPTQENLRARAASALPAYMVPAAFVELEELPLTPNRKVDRKALLELESGAPSVATEYVAPRNDAEHRVTEIFRQVLRCERVGVFDDFFALGGNSLLSTQAMARLRASFEVELPLRALFEAPTAAGLAAQIEGAAPAVARPIEVVSREGPLALSFTQQRLWFLDQLEPGKSVYNVWMAWTLRGPLDAGAFERAVAEIVRRHEVLRTTFHDDEGVPRQVIGPPEAVRLEREEAPDDLPVDVWRRAVHGRMAEAVLEPFDLAVGPLVRPVLVRIADDEHLFCLSAHHTVFDGWSMGRLRHELTALYVAFARDEPSPLPELRVQYADYAAWQRSHHDTPEHAREIEWWRGALGGLSVLELPTDRPRPATQSYRGANQSRAIPARLLDELERLGAGESATPFMVLLTALNVLLHRYSGQDDISVGSAVAGRGDRQLEELMGYFANTLVLRTKLEGDPTFRELLQRVRAVCLGAYDHQDTPFEQLVDELQPERDLSYTPLFQTLFVLDDSLEASNRLGDLAIEPFEPENRVARTDLTLWARRHRDGLYATLEYATDLFDADTIERMLANFEVLLAAVAADPDQRVSSLTLLTEAERESVLVGWNDTDASYPSTPLHAQFEQRVDEDPRAVALVFPNGTPGAGGRKLTYGQLDERANRLANHLRSSGVRPGELVGLCLDRSPDMVVALLAILKAGAAYVPLDPGFPGERLTYMASDAGLRTIVTTTELRELLADCEAAAVCLDQQRQVIAEAPETRPDVAVAPDARAYVIYTSGSTGRPKGVEIEHRAVSNFLTSMQREPGFERGDRLLAVTTLSFDISVLEMLLPLTSGGAVVVATKEAAADGERLAELIDVYHPDVMQATPATWRMLILSGWAGGPGLRILCGGEALPRELADELLERGREVWNLYGPTEATIWSTLARVKATPGPVSIGRPIASTQIYVVDRNLQPVPIGVPGELFIGGDGLARGYLERPELTSERFLANPFHPTPGGRIYRTGDLARWRRDGSLECLGRIDNQVKLRGFRIELGEIEAVLDELPGVHQCVTVLREDRPGDARLVAYYVAEPDAEVGDLRASAGERLPAYMVPSAAVEVDAFPLTPNGKVDRRALLRLQTAAPATEVEFVAPRTPLEERVAAILGEVLGAERVGARDDFFELGGNSLLTTQAVARLRSAFGVDMPLRTLFEAPTVEQLAQRIQAAAPAHEELIPRAPREAGPLPLSTAQQRLWFLDRLEPGKAVYNVWMAFALHGPFDGEAFERALGQVVQRHEILRTHFSETDGVPAQELDAPGKIRLQRWENGGDAGAGPWRAEVRRRLEAAVQEPFDLERGPLFRPFLARIKSDEHVFAVVAHHTIFDGWSMGRLQQELAALYAAETEGRPSPLPEPELQYADYAVWQRSRPAEQSEAELAWWREHLAGLPVLELPTDRPRPAAQSYRGENATRAIPAPVADALDTLGAREGTTPFMLLLAAFQVLLHRYSGQSDFGIGSAVAGRAHRQLEPLMGYFANTIVLRADLDGRPTFRELLRRVRETALGAYDHQDTPFEQLVDELQPERDLSYTPLFQALFVLDDSLESDDRMGALELEATPIENHVARTDLTLWARRHAGGLHATLEYATDLFEAANVERMLEHLERLLTEVVAHPDVPVDELELLTEEERARLLVDWNDTAAGYPVEPLHVQFEAQADRTPDATAIVLPSLGSGEVERLTYRELDRVSNQLARYLRSRGVESGALVGLCLERSIEMLAAQLAILKTGAAYVPLDPGFPAERLTYMAEDAELEVIVTGDALSSLFAATRAHAVRIDSHWDDVEAMLVDRLRSEVAPADRAYVIYTSGSTGRPKGVEIEHRAVSNFLESMRREPGFEAGETLLAVTTLSFDISVLETLLPLTSGGTVIMAPKGATTDAEVLSRLIAEHRPNVMQATPATWRMLLLAGWSGDPALRLFCGGEALPRELADELLPKGRELWNLYGPTEATIWSTAARVTAAAGPVTIGRPIANTRVYVLSATGQPTPVGVPGELWIAGDGLARGYLRRPELTAERFVPDPFAAEDGARMYRTGDLARWRRDGTLECLGRVDNQVKLRGFRIELGEIESVIGETPGISQSVVVLREDRPGDERLVAYFVAEPHAAPETADLRARAAERLPAYMAPSAYVELGALPLTPNGKVDRRALLALGPIAGAVETVFVPPRNEVERRIAEIFAETLAVDLVGIHDPFFELGGNSLLTTQALARIRSTLEVELPLRAFFEGPTVAQLAVRVAAAAPAERQTIAPLARDGSDLPLSYTQQRLWFLDQLEPGKGVYNVWMAWTLRGALDVDAFDRAVAEVVRRHEVLRTHFPDRDGVPRQEIADPSAVRLERIERPEDAAPAAWREAVERRMSERVRSPFDLSRGPLLRVALFGIQEDEHVFCLTAHHTIFDGWSMGRFRTEVGALYAAFARGGDSPLAEPGIQYADYAAWQRGLLESEAHRADVEWWAAELRGTPVLELPTDRARPAAQSYRGANVTRAIPAELVEGLERLGSEESATPFMTLLATLEVLLHRYSGQDDFAVGSAVAGRSHAQLEELMGYFANTLVLRAGLEGDPTFRELLGRVRATAIAAYERQDTPFEELVDELQPERDLSYTPLFQTLFVLDDSREPSARMGELVIEPCEVENRVARTDLTLWARRHAGGLAATFEYATDLFDAATIERMLAHLERIAAAVVEDPDLRLSEIALLSETEVGRIVRGWNDTGSAFGEGPIHALFEAQVDRAPDATAVVFPSEPPTRLTYRQLDERANRIARALVARGAEPGSTVGLCLERSLDMVAAQLAIQKAGAAYVPLDPGFPADRLAYMVADAGLELVVTTSDLADTAGGARTLQLDAEADAIAAESGARLGLAVSPTDRMYVIYTSGSTGRPKGVELEHRSVANFLASMAREPGFRAGDSLLAVTTLSFDISVLETMLPLVTGGKLIVAPKEATADGERLMELVGEHRPTVLQATPATWRLLLLAEWSGDRELRAFCGGEALPRDLAEELLPRVGELWNLYGPTETTIWSAVARVEHGEGAVPIGRPIANTRIYVLDPSLHPTPVGVPGELWIAGDGLARGYLERPELTAERFVSDPFAEGRRMYRTGDLARWRPEGALECLGRVDNQVKLRGFRIELGEIEAVVGEAAGIEQCVALVREERLVAYVVLEPDAAADAGALKEAAAAVLPAYMVPSAFQPLEAFPLTPNGKIDRLALAALDPVAPGATAEYVAPRDDREERLAAIFSEVLGIERVGVHDDFFELGGNSLLTTQVIARVRAAFTADVPLRALFEAPSVAGLAGRLGDAAPIVERGIVRIPRDGAPLPLSFTQQRLWFLDQLEPANPVYNVWVSWTLRGPLDADALERAVAEIVRRHEVLRTHFSEIDGIPSQEIAGPETILLERERRPEEVDGEEWRAEVQRRVDERVRRPFDLATGPLFRAVLAEIADGEHVFCLCAHHTIFDGWSAGRFRIELAALYEAFTRGEGSPLPEPELQYADYAAWQRDYFEGDVYDRQIAWWREQLTGVPVLELPTDRPRPAEQSYRGANVTRLVPADLMDSLEQLGGRENATPFMVLLAAMNVLLHRYGGQADLSIGSVVAGRARRELEELMGYFANTLVLRTSLEGDPTFRQLLGRVRETALGAYDHQDTPFEQLVAELQPARDMSFTPLFQALFVLDDSRAPDERMGELTVEEFEVENRVARTDVTLWARRHEGGLSATLEYATDLFERETIERMLVHYERLLAGIVEDPDRPISQLPLLPDAERRELVVARNATAADFPSEPVHAQFEAQVDRTPDATALLFPTLDGPERSGESLSYRELDQRANLLAHHLIARGVQSGDLVGLCLERSLEMVVAQLAIQKAGAAYVPLDPAFPQERLVYMVGDSGLGLVVTRSELEPLLEGAEVARVLLDAAAKEIAGESSERPAVAVDADARMYVIYTSGSTGRPKGVEIEHRSVSNFLASMAREPGLTADETFLAVTTLSFDISVLELMLPLVVGATVAIASSEITADGDQLRALLEQLQPDVMQATPATWRMLLLTGWRGSPQLRIFCGGEALPRDLANELLPQGAELWNLYGPTEATIWSTSWRVEAGEGSVVIGQPIANTQVYVLDSAGEPTPAGVPGELWIGGDGLARGYLDRPGLTAERFVPDPFSLQGGARMYRTGDQARWRRDGMLECLGRIDNQVKLRGFRIELGEIDAVLTEAPSVHQCVSIVREDTPGDQRLVAYYVAEAEAAVEPSDLRERARARLPGYMVPAAFVELEQLPLTPNGKVDRRALLALGRVQTGSGAQFVAASSPLELALAEIWVELLGVQRVGVYDNFFDLGGHSLLSVQVTARVRDRLGVHITPRDLMLQNLGQLAAVCGERMAADEARESGRHGPGRRLIRALNSIFRSRGR